MPPAPDPFWLCHECGAQMRPIEREGVKHCASCDGEFLEILDATVNPDPYHELPPPPPARPQSSPPEGSQHYHDHSHLDESPPNFIQSLLGGLFGAAVAEPHGNAQSASSPASPGSGPRNNRGGAGHTFQFNVGNNGHASVTFGSFGGADNMGPFGPVGGGRDDDDLESFFPGFGMPPNAHRRDQGQQRQNQNPFMQTERMRNEDLIGALMNMFMNEGGRGLGGPPGAATLGDYVMTEQGFDHILEQLMQAAGPQGPIPASDVVIKGLPRFKLTEESLAESTFKDCPVCKDDFEVGNEVMRIPCKHIFHPDCLEPWLKTNGSCPVCRFSLVPEDGERPEQAPNTSSDNQTTATSPHEPSREGASGTPAETPGVLTNVLRRLWGQSGTSNPASPISEYPPNPTTTHASDPPTPRVSVPPTPHVSDPPTPQLGNPLHSGIDRSQDFDRPPTSRHVSQQEAIPTMSSAIPEDYRERHRRREQQQQEDQHRLHDDLD